MKQPITGKLNEQQRYLLNRIPSANQLNGYKSRPESAEVKRARRVIERWDKAKELRQCQNKKRNEALVRKAREAVYFSPPEKALQIVRQVEKLLAGCPV